MVGGALVSGVCFLLGSVLNVGLSVWALTHDDDEYYYALPFRILSCAAATFYLLDVALDDDRRSKVVAVFFGIGAALELLSTILLLDWMLLVAVHSYLVSAVLVLSTPPDSPIEGVGDVLFGLGCSVDVLLSYFYWNEKFASILLWGDILSAALWFLNAIVVVVDASREDCEGVMGCCSLSPPSSDGESTLLEDEEQDSSENEQMLAPSPEVPFRKVSSRDSLNPE